MASHLWEGEEGGEHGTAQGGELDPLPWLHVGPTNAPWHVKRQ